MMAAAVLFGVGGAILIGIGVFFAFLRPALLPEDFRYLQRTSADIDTALPRLRSWLRLVFVVLGGYAFTSGMLTLYLAATEVRDGNRVAVAILALAGACSIGVMTLVNVVLHSAFRWALCATTIVWVAATSVAVAA